MLLFAVLSERAHQELLRCLFIKLFRNLNRIKMKRTALAFYYSPHRIDKLCRLYLARTPLKARKA